MLFAAEKRRSWRSESDHKTTDAKQDESRATKLRTSWRVVLALKNFEKKVGGSEKSENVVIDGDDVGEVRKVGTVDDSKGCCRNFGNETIPKPTRKRMLVKRSKCACQSSKASQGTLL